MAISELEPAFLLHSRPYRNTSVIANFFTLNHGRVDAVIRGARGQKSKIRGLIQVFTPVVINWYGRNELVTLKSVEANDYLNKFSGDAILYGMYVNEILIRVLRAQDAHVDLYIAYETLLTNLSKNQVEEAELRIFEKKLLESLGYALHLDYELETGAGVDEEEWYQYIPDRGPIKLAFDDRNKEKAFLGASLLAISRNDFSDKEVLRDAKRLMRYALRQLLGDKPLKSRELFVK